jgi:GDP-L-fucose synthase
MERTSKIYVAGHRGMVGSSIVRKLQTENYNNLILKTSSELDLRNQSAVEKFFNTEKPEYVFLAAAKVGGIMANDTYRADFLYENLMIQSNVIHQSYLYRVRKLLFLGSSCIYPKLAPQPLKEESLLSGYLEETNEPYAIAKITGIKLCENYRRQYSCNFISAMPTNLYGPNDSYDLNNSHVIPAMIRKFVEAKNQGQPEIQLWGTGSPLREFLHVDDLADACLLLMNDFNEIEFVNVGSGHEISIKDLALLIKKLTNYKGELSFNASKPDGTPRKLMDGSKLSLLNWSPKIRLEKGLGSVIQEYVRTHCS